MRRAVSADCSESSEPAGGGPRDDQVCDKATSPRQGPMKRRSSRRMSSIDIQRSQLERSLKMRDRVLQEQSSIHDRPNVDLEDDALGSSWDSSANDQQELLTRLMGTFALAQETGGSPKNQAALARTVDLFKLDAPRADGACRRRRSDRRTSSTESTSLDKIVGPKTCLLDGRNGMSSQKRTPHHDLDDSSEEVSSY